MRDLHVTDRVRNARSDGTAYETPRQKPTSPAASHAIPRFLDSLRALTEVESAWITQIGRAHV